MENLLDDDFVEDSTLETRSLNSYEFAGFWIRAAASIIDSLILLPIIALGIYNSLQLKSMILMIVLSILSILYKPYFEWKNSRTPGKKAVGIRLMDEAGSAISKKQAIDRFLPWVISYVIGLVMNIQLYLSPGFKDVTSWMELSLATNESPLYMVNSLYGIVFLVLAISIGANLKKQGLHDKFAGTYCVKN